jgi:uncharacterized YccA/Bax inhibitor family protein
MRSGNPAFAGNVFADWARADRRGQVMTVEGTALKSLVLLVIATATASFAWTQVGRGTISVGLLMVSGLGGFVLALATIWNKTWAPVTAPLYAACQGVLLGAVSNLFEQAYRGIATQAVGLTFGVMFLMLFLYGTRIIRVTDKLAAGIVAATGAVCLIYFVSFLLRMFGVTVPFIHSAGPIGIVFSLFVVALAAFNLLLDFDAIERGARYGAPKFMEWYGAFGLMVTLIWLYLEVLKLLAKLQAGRDRDD